MELRRIAILVSQMDEETANLMLAGVPHEQHIDIRNAVAELGDISEEELADVARELQEVAIATEFDEICGEHGLPLSPSVPLDGALTPHSFGGNDSLSDVVRSSSVERLLSVLHDEYPQTLAAVAAKLPPDDAAKFLAGLSDSVRADVICRIAELEATDDDVIRDLSDEIANRLDAELARIDGSLVGRDAVKAILFASKGEQRSRLIASLSAGEPRLATQLGVSVENNTADPLTTASGGDGTKDLSESAGVGSADVDASWTFDRVLGLDPNVLANAVRSADFEVVLLALVGASPSQTEHFLSGLSRSEASRFRRGLSTVGPIRVRDIELAQRQLTYVARRADAGSKCEPAKARKGLTLSV